MPFLFANSKPSLLVEDDKQYSTCLTLHVNIQQANRSASLCSAAHQKCTCHMCKVWQSWPSTQGINYKLDKPCNVQSVVNCLSCKPLLNVSSQLQKHCKVQRRTSHQMLQSINATCISFGTRLRNHGVQGKR